MSTKVGLNIVADENIPQVAEYFQSLGNIQLLPGRAICSAVLENADILLVRSVTQINANLLGNKLLKFVGSATIGADHLDTDFLNQRCIPWATAPGSNAESVVHYVMSVLCSQPGLLEKLLSGAGKLGIIGLGNVGSLLASTLRHLGIQCLAYDPFLNTQDHSILTSIENVLRCDVVSCHTPLTRSGPFPTFHMLDEKLLSKLNNNCLLINTGRGAIIDTDALLAINASPRRVHMALDVWENEPDINPGLVALADIATPHIAGYSFQGKLKGTQMIYEACCRQLNIDPENHNLTTLKSALSLESNISGVNLLKTAILKSYDVKKESQGFKSIVASGAAIPECFDDFRKYYPRRNDCSSISLCIPKPVSRNDRSILRALGFSINDQ